ncbi:MAG: xanthine dehydrogenase [Acidobacteria bacterium]|nr:xanthine dehydrogenase [Acidobacteriota bacterium]
MNEEVFRAVNEAFQRGESAALVTIIRTQGSTPQRVGAKMLVYADGRTVGTIGGGCYENDAFWKARQALDTRKPMVARYELADDLAEESGLICGGQMEVYIDPLEASPQLYLVGAGHVAQHLGQIAPGAGFRLHVIDDREKFSNRERFPDAVECVVDDIPTWLENADLPESAYVVILTRGHRHDLDALRALATRPLRYLGLIGSRAKVARLHEALNEEGIAVTHPDRLHAPVGLDIGAVTPHEIAVSILAELIAVKYNRLDGGSARSLRWTPRALADDAPPAGDAPAGDQTAVEEPAAILKSG